MQNAESPPLWPIRLFAVLLWYVGYSAYHAVALKILNDFRGPVRPVSLGYTHTIPAESL